MEQYLAQCPNADSDSAWCTAKSDRRQYGHAQDLLSRLSELLRAEQIDGQVIQVASTLQPLKLGVLKQRARNEGVPSVVLETADDQDDPKAAVIEHILAKLFSADAVARWKGDVDRETALAKRYQDQEACVSELRGCLLSQISATVWQNEHQRDGDCNGTHSNGCLASPRKDDEHSDTWFMGHQRRSSRQLQNERGATAATEWQSGDIELRQVLTAMQREKAVNAAIRAEMYEMEGALVDVEQAQAANQELAEAAVEHAKLAGRLATSRAKKIAGQLYEYEATSMRQVGELEALEVALAKTESKQQVQLARALADESKARDAARKAETEAKDMAQHQNEVSILAERLDQMHQECEQLQVENFQLISEQMDHGMSVMQLSEKEAQHKEEAAVALQKAREAEEWKKSMDAKRKDALLLWFDGDNKTLVRQCIVCWRLQSVVDKDAREYGLLKTHTDKIRTMNVELALQQQDHAMELFDQKLVAQEMEERALATEQRVQIESTKARNSLRQVQRSTDLLARALTVWLHADAGHLLRQYWLGWRLVAHESKASAEQAMMAIRTQEYRDEAIEAEAVLYDRQSLKSELHACKKSVLDLQEEVSKLDEENRRHAFECKTADAIILELQTRLAKSEERTHATRQRAAETSRNQCLMLWMQGDDKQTLSLCFSQWRMEAREERWRTQAEELREARDEQKSMNFALNLQQVDIGMSIREHEQTAAELRNEIQQLSEQEQEHASRWELAELAAVEFQLRLEEVEDGPPDMGSTGSNSGLLRSSPTTPGSGRHLSPRINDENPALGLDSTRIAVAGQAAGAGAWRLLLPSRSDRLVDLSALELRLAILTAKMRADAAATRLAALQDEALRRLG